MLDTNERVNRLLADLGRRPVAAMAYATAWAARLATAGEEEAMWARAEAAVGDDLAREEEARFPGAGAELGVAGHLDRP